MTSRPQSPPAAKHKPVGFVQITADQLAIPMAGRGASQDEGRVSPLQKLVLFAIEKISWGGKRKCDAKDHELADAIGLTGSKRARRNQVQIALHGRKYRKWNAETGKRDGETVSVPGLCDPRLGFVEVLLLPTGERELVLTARWLEWNRFRVFRDGSGVPEPELRADTPAAELTGAPHTGDGPTNQAVGPLPGSPEPATKETASAIAEVPSARNAESASESTGPPSRETVAEVLGPNFVDRSREDQASRFVHKLLNQSVLLTLGEDGRIRPKIGAGADPLSPAEKEVLLWLKPELVSRLRAEAGRSSPRPNAGAPPAAERAAPRVGSPAEIRAMIANLAARPAADDSDCHVFARRLATEPGFRHNDADPATSEATYSGLARDTKRGDLPQAVMTEAFEAACRPKVRNRGAMFVSEVKRLKADFRKRGREGGAPS